ncbi:DUF2283 domain-containing protein [Gulosibacter sp. 10]|uniref:DUF2283 domain-containing protein n=1 Tax=Gulosibacter sp. 10 TaxID=1255570 RepID=UPI000B35E759|nr:DUF2283 domain-containing protein [Gulosibacter sp. 10]
MNIEYDPEANAAYIPLSQSSNGGVEYTATGITPPLGEGEINLDFNGNGQLIGIEIIGARSLLRPEDIENTPPTKDD